MKKTLAYRLRRTAVQLLSLPAALLSTSLLRDMTVQMIIRRARRLPADEALRLMFDVDARLYTEQGHQSVRYGNGVHSKHRHLRYHDFFVDRIAAHERVLDIGCGIGALAYDVAQRSGARVVGVDYSQRNLAQARSQFPDPRVEYRYGDVLESMPDEPFDVVVLSNVLEHFSRREEFLRGIVAHTGAARLLIRVPLFERDWRVPLKQELGVEWRLDEDHETEYRPEQFQSEMAAAGLSVKHLEIHWGEIWAEVGVAQEAVADAA